MMAGHDHAQGHDHPHAPEDFKDEDDLTDPALLRYRAIRSLLIENGVVDGATLRRIVEKMEAVGPHIGAQIVARAWVDDAYRERLLSAGREAVGELGHAYTEADLIVVENTRVVHNVIVCTLCSCYPRSILGQPPAWYVSRSYRSRTVKDPRGVLKEFGLTIPDDVEVRVHDSTADMRYLVLPMRPVGAGGLGETELAELVTRDCLVGTAVPTFS